MDWTLTIKGSAPDVHKEAEADTLVDTFVAQLTAAGHQISVATFTHEPRPDAVSVDKLAPVQAP